MESEALPLKRRSQSKERWGMASWLLGQKHPGMSTALLGAAGVSLLGGWGSPKGTFLSQLVLLGMSMKSYRMQRR